MSKIAQYLNEHLLGEVSDLAKIKAPYAADCGALKLQPDLLVTPKVTNDIRKVARFSWQLAEKGHVLGLTPRGQGLDETGAALSSGALLDLSKYFNNILYISGREKPKVVHVQAGASIETLAQTLKWQGLTIGALKDLTSRATVGGLIASGFSGPARAKHGSLADAIDRMEVVLANGDLMEVGRISKRELSRKQGQQTFEGEIYRQIDGLIEDNQQLIDSLSSQDDQVGYKIDQVKNKDGSIDLTPLFVGSQGTLGIISEIVLRADFYTDEETVVVALVNSLEAARDLADLIAPLDPAVLRIIEAQYFNEAKKHGKKFFFEDEEASLGQALLYISFDDFNSKAQARKLKKVVKILTKNQVKFFTSDETPFSDLFTVRDIEQITKLPLGSDQQNIKICPGAFVPLQRQGEFVAQLQELAKKHSCQLPLIIDTQSQIVTVYLSVHLKKVSDKQKIFKLGAEIAKLAEKLGGALAGSNAEGRLNSLAIYPQIEPEVLALYAKVRRIFDPFGTLNPGVKTEVNLKDLAKLVRSE